MFVYRLVFPCFGGLFWGFVGAGGLGLGVVGVSCVGVVF